MKQADLAKQQRDSNIELFRIILMLFIVAHHYTVNSGIIEYLAETSFLSFKSIFFYTFTSWGKPAINCFIMITGYYMCQKRITLKKFLKLLFQILFYRLIIYSIFIMTGYIEFNFTSFAQAVIPVFEISNIFDQAFLIFFLFIPFLNLLIVNLNEKMFIRLIILCLFTYTFISTFPFFKIKMNYVSWFMIVYLIAAYVRLYPKEIFSRQKFWIVLFSISFAISVLSIWICKKLSISIFYFFDDSNQVFAVIIAFCAFIIFNNMKVKYNRFINIVASASFGVLLIHANSSVMRQWLWVDLLQNANVFDTGWCYFHFICSVLAVYMICTFIDLLRIYLMERPFFRLYDKIFSSQKAKLYTLENRLLKRLHIEQ